jgi:hypothetical protein
MLVPTNLAVLKTRGVSVTLNEDGSGAFVPYAVAFFTVFLYRGCLGNHVSGERRRRLFEDGEGVARHS